MARKARKQSESGFYHLYARGTGRQLIFEDDRDRRQFVELMERAADDTLTELHAYCLMGNHYHAVVKTDFQSLADFAHRLNQNYARYFNQRHERTGHLFQDRYGSEPVDDDSYYLEAIRYVHRNPVEARMTSTCDYPWSSYREYLGEPSLVRTDLALGMLGGPEKFAEFHSVSGKAASADDLAMNLQEDAADLLERARRVLFPADPNNLKSLSKPQRNQGLRDLKDNGFTFSQITLVTGISRSTISRACK